MNISYLPNKPSDNGDLRISIGVDITELNNLCSSNIWKYKIEKLTDESASSGTVIENYTEAFSEANEVTLNLNICPKRMEEIHGIWLVLLDWI